MYMSGKHLETSANPAGRYSPTILLLFSCPFVYVVRDTVMMFLAGGSNQGATKTLDLGLTQIFGTTACRSIDLSRTGTRSDEMVQDPLVKMYLYAFIRDTVWEYTLLVLGNKTW